jgi:hypothetical protein
MQPTCGNSVTNKDAWFEISNIVAGQAYNYMYTEKGHRQTWVEIYERPNGKNCNDPTAYLPVSCTKENDVSYYPNSTASATFVPKNATSTYYVRLMRANLTTDQFLEGKICISKSYPNDEPCGAISLPVQPAKGTNPVIGQNYAAADWQPLAYIGPTCGPNNDVWYKFIPEECSVNVFVKNLTPATYEIQAAILESVDGTCNNLKEVVPCGGDKNQYADILLNADGLTVGKTYYIIVDGYSPPYFNATGEHSVEVYKKPNPTLCPDIPTPCDCGKPGCITPSPFPNSAAGNFALTQAQNGQTVSGCFDLTAQKIPVLGGSNKATFCASYTATAGDDFMAFDNVVSKDASCSLLANLGKNIVYEEGNCTAQIPSTCKDINGTTPVYRLTVGKTYKFCRQVVADGGDLDCVGKTYQGFCAFLWKINNKTTIDKKICNGDTFTFNGKTYDTSGSYETAFPNATGCDSIVVLNLTVLPKLVTSLKVKDICPEKGYKLGNTTYVVSGVYTDVLKNALGCDSTVTVDLTVLPAAKSTLDKTVCFNEKFKIGNEEFSATGTYTVKVPSSKGCDSTITLNLTVLAAKSKTNNITVCFGGKYTYKGVDYDKTGVYNLEKFTAVNGCDSSLLLNLTVLPDYSNVKISRKICTGQTYLFGTETLDKAGVYTKSFQSSYLGLNCDSTVTLTLTIENRIETLLEKVICFGENYPFGGIPYSTTTKVQKIFKASGGCDSIVTLDLTVRAKEQIFTETRKVCEGKSTIVNGQVISKDTTIIVKSTYPEGCDSATTTVIVKIVRPIDEIQKGYLCNKGFYEFNGKKYTTPGTYLDTLKSGDCIEIAYTIIIEQNKKASISSTSQSCNNNNCDGTATVSMINGVAPITYQWSNGDTTSMITKLCKGVYKVTVTDRESCVIVEEITINQDTVPFAVKAIESKSTCNNAENGSVKITEPLGADYSYLWSNGQTTVEIKNLKKGDYFVTVTNKDGCTSVKTFKVDADPTFTVTVTATAKSSCEQAKDGTAIVTNPLGANYAYLWSNGVTTLSNTSLMAGSAKVTVTDTNTNCTAEGEVKIESSPSSVTVTTTPKDTVLIIKGQSQSVTVATNATNPTYTWSPSATSSNGSSFVLTPTESNTYTVTVTDIKGCTATTSLTINVKEVMFPTIITPSSNDDNGEFKPYPNVGLIINKLIIFDRWGTQVYSYETAKNAWWNGKLNNTGDELASDVYIYYVEYQIVLDNKTLIRSKGEITLIR